MYGRSIGGSEGLGFTGFEARGTAGFSGIFVTSDCDGLDSKSLQPESPKQRHNPAPSDSKDLVIIRVILSADGASAMPDTWFFGVFGKIKKRPKISMIAVWAWIC